MNDPVAVLDLFVRGLAAGAMAAWSFSIARSAVSRQARWVTLALGLSVISWLITESSTLRVALGSLNILVAMAYPLGGLFWLFVLTVFEDRPVTWLALAPSIILVILGFVMNGVAGGSYAPVWIVFNGFSGLLAVHAGFVVARGWRDDLIEGRRRARASLLGLVSLFVIAQVVASFLARLDPSRPWRAFTVSGAFGGAILAALTLAGAVIFLQARPALFGGLRRTEAGVDARAEAAERQVLGKLEAFTEGEGWRREGLAIGGLAAELEVPEHRLRRLINQRLGHRNFADFINSHRIEAAKRRLSDPGEARVTIAAIAFDLGYGSLGPFNRAFRSATGASPTEWRRRALSASPILEEAV